MTENNEKQFKAHLEVARNLTKELYKRELTDEEIESIRLKYDNPVAKEIDFRPGETDLTHLKQSEINQMLIRGQMDTNAYLKFINETMNKLYLAFMSFYKEDLKVDSFKQVEELKKKQYKEFKGE